MVCYEHAKAVHSTRAEPRSGPRQGAWYTFHKHWLATAASPRHGQGPAPSPTPAHLGPASLPGGARLHPPSCGRSPHTSAKGKCPTASAWALEAHDIGPGRCTDRAPARERSHIATAATHPAHGRETVAKRHTWQVAMQVAAGRALHYAEQLRRKGTGGLPSPSRAPPRPGISSRPAHRRVAPQDLAPRHRE